MKGGQGERLTSAPGTSSVGSGVLHVDMDAFFASVALLERPELVGTPVIIGHEGGRGVVSSANYEARRFGVRSAMPVGRALQLCPKATVLAPRYERYREASAQVMAIFRDVTPLVEPLSIDEAFLDVTGAVRLFGEPQRIAAMIRARVRADTGLTCSVGVAPSKFVAKVASTRSKPDGLLVVPPDGVLAFLRPLPVGVIWGVGAATAASLERRGIRTVADLADTPRSVLIGWIGQASGARLHELAWGRDPRQVETARQEKSIGHENTFGTDVRDEHRLRLELLEQADRVAARLRAGGWRARTLALKLRFADFTTVTRSRTLGEPTDVARRIHEETVSLLTAERLAGRAVRLLGTRAEQLVPADAQMPGLWSDDERWRAAETVRDSAVARFGRGIVTPAALLGGTPRDRERLVDSEG